MVEVTRESRRYVYSVSHGLALHVRIEVGKLKGVRIMNTIACAGKAIEVWVDIKAKHDHPGTRSAIKRILEQQKKQKVTRK